MKFKNDPCSHNIVQFLRQKGAKSLSQSSEQLLNCQGSLIGAIPAVHLAFISFIITVWRFTQTLGYSRTSVSIPRAVTTKYGLQWLFDWQDSCQSRLCNFVQKVLAKNMHYRYSS